MSTDIIVSLPDTLCERGQLWAQQARRTLPDFLVEAIESSLLPLGRRLPLSRLGRTRKCLPQPMPSCHPTMTAA